MDTSQGETAAHWLNTASETHIREVIKNYGEERFAKQIARAIVAARTRGAIATTRQLAEIVATAVSTREPNQNPATRTFQALRIYINQELEELAQVLTQCLQRLNVGGRLVVISFHSLEDRIVKRFLREATHPDRLPHKLPVRAVQIPLPQLRLVAKPIRPTDAEVMANPRARSAIMRVAERLVA
jgi:16S rRNA (cytosine1402-N4)-methyltransferase